MIRRPPRSTLSSSSAASDVYKRQEDAVRFDVNKATLTAQAKTNLDKLVSVFNEYSDTNIDIFGYTDSSGSANYNLTLSKNRAKSVKSYLISKGISSSRL